MSDIYKDYATMTSATVVPHHNEVLRTAAQFRRVLLPMLRHGGLELERASIFEFGAGWGKNMLAFKALGARDVRGVDISPEQVALGKTLGLAGLSLIRVDQDLHHTVDGETFDLLLAMDVLEHLTLGLIDQFARSVPMLLRPDGLLVVQVPNDLAPLNPIRAGDLTHLRAFTGESVVQFLRLCRLEPLWVRGVAFPGSGPTYFLRQALTRWILGPCVKGFTRVLYGRADPHSIYTANILAVGKRTRGT